MSSSELSALHSQIKAMFRIIKQHPILSAVVIGTGAILAIEFTWRGLKYLASGSGSDINEVLFFNNRCTCNDILNSDKIGTVCTIDHHADNIERMKWRIGHAIYSLDIAIYTFTSFELLDAFKDAIKRGVVVRVISDPEMVYSSGSQVKQLAKFGIAVRGPQTTFMMHHKFCVIDGEARVQEIVRQKGRVFGAKPFQSIVMWGSLNWTKQGLRGNWENCSISSNKSLTSAFQKEFDDMWQDFGSNQY